MAITVTEPKKWAVELGATADVNEIPETTDTESGLASMTALFPQLTALPLDAGGRAPQREDFNGLYKLIGQWVRFYMYGGVPSWTSSAAYPAGSLCSYNNSTWTALRASTNIKPAEGKYWHALSNFYTSSLLVTDLLNKVYPVGSIYMSAVNVSPASFLGGTWQAIEQGRMLMAAGSSWQAGTTGGAAYHTLTVQEMPAHDHSAVETAAGQHAHTASIAAAGDHTHAGTADAAGQHAHSATSATAGEHAHTGTADTAGAHTHGASTGSAGAHSHSGSTNNAGNHYHTGTTNSAGSHSHTRGSMNITGSQAFHGINTSASVLEGEGNGALYPSAITPGWPKWGVGSGTQGYGAINFDASRSWTGSTSTDGSHTHGYSTSWAGEHAHSLSISSAGAHTHSVTVASSGGHYHSLTIAKAGGHAHTIAVAGNGKHTHNLSIAAAGAHVHSAAIAAAGAHTHAITIGKTGSGAAFSILPPYIAVYMWRRTA